MGAEQKQNVQTPRVLAEALDRLAEEKANRIIRDCKTAVIMNVCPEWMRSDEVEAYFGLPANQLKAMAVRGEVIAKKLDPHLTQSAVIFKVADIRKAIGRLTPYDDWVKDRPDLKTPTKGE